MAILTFSYSGQKTYTKCPVLSEMDPPFYNINVHFFDVSLESAGPRFLTRPAQRSTLNMLYFGRL